VSGHGTASGDDMTTLQIAVLALVQGITEFLPISSLLMRWLRRASFAPFVIYRCLLGALLLAYAYGG
jgi:undecaprenyl-diphosphatase